MPRQPTASKIKGFIKGDLIWLDMKYSVDDNVYSVEGIIHRDTYPSLLKLRLVLRTFYSTARLDGFVHYDETLCSLLEVNHVEELQTRYGKIIKDIYDLHAGNKKEVKSASTDSPGKRVRKRKAVEPEVDKPTSPRRIRKKAL